MQQTFNLTLIYFRWISASVVLWLAETDQLAQLSIFSVSSSLPQDFRIDERPVFCLIASMSNSERKLHKRVFDEMEMKMMGWKQAEEFYSKNKLTCLNNGEYRTWSYLVPGDLWDFSRLCVVLYVRTEDVFALTQLGLLKVPHLGVVTETRVVLGHRERHRHLHTVRGVPAKDTKPTRFTLCTGF